MNEFKIVKIFDLIAIDVRLTYLHRLQANSHCKCFASCCVATKVLWIDENWWFFGFDSNDWIDGFIQEQARNNRQFIFVSEKVVKIECESAIS